MQRRKEIKMQLWILVTISLRTPRLCVKFPDKTAINLPQFFLKIPKRSSAISGQLKACDL